MNQDDGPVLSGACAVHRVKRAHCPVLHPHLKGILQHETQEPSLVCVAFYCRRMSFLTVSTPDGGPPTLSSRRFIS